MAERTEGSEGVPEVPLETGSEKKSKGLNDGEGEEVIAGNPEEVERVNTSLQLEGVDQLPSTGDVESRSPPAIHPVTLLPSPMDLISNTHPAESLHPPDSPTTSLISSFRSQLAILADQSHALNQKLISSLSRHADLEDSHLSLQARHKELEGKAGELEKEKKKWEESMNTGLLVERSQIKDEMQKLAAGLVEEERRRGSAEEGRRKVEDEVDELAASLFDQANTMVAAERMSRVQAESRLKETEENLAAAEAAVRDMQLHLQSLPSSAVPLTSPPPSSTAPERRLLSSHVPYTEFITFLTHLRALRPLKDVSKSMFPPPQVTTLLAQQFIARTINEDHDPTLRLDAAPDLSYFSRRTVGQAIIAGELIIEPVSASTILSSTTSAMTDIGCSLCGKPVFPVASTATPGGPSSPAASHFGPPPIHPTQHRNSSRFSLKPFFNASSPSTTAIASPTSSPLASPHPSNQPSFSSVYIFRIAKPAVSSTSGNDKETKLYPLCKTGWCLERLRATCDLWHFLRNGVIHVVWQGDDGYLLAAEHPKEAPTPDRRVSGTSVTSLGGDPAAAAPPPERKRSAGWGLGFKLGGGGEKPGWRAFGRTGESASPPATPVGDKERESLGLEDETGEGKEELGAALELPGQQDLSMPSIREPGESPIKTREAAVDGEGAGGEETEVAVPAALVQDESDESLLPPVLKRGDSSHSLTASNAGTEEGLFSTPKGQNQDLSPDVEADTENNPDTEGVVASEEVVDLASPLIGETKPTPPPIPKRAAGRDRASKTGDKEASPPRASQDEALAIEARPSPSVEGAESSEAISMNDDHKREDVHTKPPPPLPPRHPKTPTAQIAGNVVEGEKRYVNGGGWEAKTWKQVVKLKEGMWRARVGVHEA